MGKTLMEVKGTDGQVELMTDRVIIHRRGFLNMFKYGLNTRREIPISSISSVNFRDATLFKMGEIDFDFAGRSQQNRKQNTVVFQKRHHAEFLALKEKIFEMMIQQQRK
jgi:hypothetical protein